PEPRLAVLGHDLVAVPEPVLVPVEDRRGVVHAEDVDRLECATRIRAREVVLVHAQAPDEVLKLPRGAYTRDLENEPAIVVEEATHLREELRVTLEQMMRALRRWS
ncbi:hypothetical protein H0H87_003101, partial [Tephrocybe sp. NHM501043]